MGRPIAKVDRVVATKPAEKAETLRAPAALLQLLSQVTNSQSYIQRCVNSVLRQTFLDWEQIIIDDGSTDATPQIVDAYQATDCRIRVVHQSNHGYSYSTNLALHLSRGECVLALDSDNWLESEDCLAHLFEKRQTLLIFTSYVYG